MPVSKHNKVNPGQYHVGGRLTPDEAARERVKQRNVAADASTPARGTGSAAAKRTAAPARTGEVAGGRTTATARARAAGRSRS
jgi:hypothetical protein